jgi:hypothetical protein
MVPVDCAPLAALTGNVLPKTMVKPARTPRNRWIGSFIFLLVENLPKTNRTAFLIF